MRGSGGIPLIPRAFSLFVSAMFSHAALSAASRRAARASQQSVNLELGGPGRPEPLITEDEMETAPSPPDLSIASGTLVRDVLPPVASPSPEQELFRRELLEVARSTFGANAASGTVHTYEAVLRGIAPKVMAKLGSAVLPMSTEAQFLSFFGAVLILGPKTPSHVTSQPAVRWNYAKLVKAAVAYWHVVRGERAAFDAEWTPRMGVFWSGVKRSCVHSTSEKLPLLFSDVLKACQQAQKSVEHLRQAVGGPDLAPGGVGLGQMLPHAMALRGAVSVSLAFFGVRGASEIAALRVKDVRRDAASGLVVLDIRQQKNDQFGVGQVSRMVAMPAWGDACPVHLTSEWLWFRSWLADFRDYAGRLATAGEEGPFLVGLARSRFGLGLAASGISASWKRCFEGRGLPPRKGGARFYVVNGMPRETTQDLGGWKSPAVMEGVYVRARSEEAIPEMREAARKACKGLEAERFVTDLGRDLCAEASEAIGAEAGAEARVWCHQFRSVRDLLVPAVVLPIREDIWNLMGRRVRALKPSTHQSREVLSWGTAFRVDLKRYRGCNPQSVARANKREAAVSEAPRQVPRVEGCLRRFPQCSQSDINFVRGSPCVTWKRNLWTGGGPGSIAWKSCPAPEIVGVPVKTSLPRRV